MYRLAICDDESIFLDDHQAMAASVLREAGIAFEMETFCRTEKLAGRLHAEPNCFDTLMLDILLGRENGVELARTLRGTGYRGGILFVTSSRDFSLAGYSVYPMNYLLKPLARDALREALLRDYQQRFQPPALSVPVRGGYAAIPLQDILYIESALHSMIIHTTDGDLVTSMSLKELRGMLPRNAFLQCHKSFLVQMGKIHSFTRSEITLVSGERVPVGRVYHQEALTAFIDYMESK